MSGHKPQPSPLPLELSSEVSPADRLAACKSYLAHQGEQLRHRHRAGSSGLEVAQARAAMIDHLLTQLFTCAMATWRRQHGEPLTAVCLIALGGYGRSELSPRSDIDIMALYPTEARPADLKNFQQHLSNEILYFLWDAKLKVGHSTRTVNEAFAEAARDIRTKTALLEARLITGSEPLFASFAQAYQNYYLKDDPKGYLASRLADQAARRAKYGDSVFLQEPDIKNGVGGLRDYQNALWMARVKLGISHIEELEVQHYLQPGELRDFQRAYDFLLRVRNELHYLSHHATDLLNLDLQPRLAQHLGYHQHEILARVEAFMQDYYRSAQTIYRVSKIVETRLALSLETSEDARISFRDLLRVRRTERTKRLDGFVLRGRELAYETRRVFEEDPVRLIRVFRHCQQLGCTPDFDLASLIRESLPLITPQVIASVDANLSFRTLLEEAGQVFPALNLMHELGVLGRFVPEFDRLTCLVQHEFYHRYTADIHTLSALRELDGVLTAADPVSEKYRAELHRTGQPTLLYLILLLHDIGKAEGLKGHSEAGVRIAGPLLERLQIDPKARSVVTFIIKNHLIMARFWQKHDLDDPHTAAAFAKIVGNAETLRYLYVHTFCDARATSANLWNSYKDTLHHRLFLTTIERLTLGKDVETRQRKHINMTRQKLIAEQIPGISPEEISAHFNLLPERYFIQTDEKEISLHLKMVNRLLQAINEADSVGSLRPIIDWQDDLNRSLTMVHVVTWDRAGLFYKLAGAFSVAGLNILSAKIISRSDHIAIDTFYVVEPGRGIVQNQAAMETFARTVETALVFNKDLLPDIEAQARRLAASRFTTDKQELQASFPPSVEVYHELTLNHIIVEVQARDQIGLLYRLAKIISDHNYDITFARINTERGVAIDTFYIESTGKDNPPDDTPRLHALRDALASIIALPPVNAAG
ncbi:MAG: [protein-PII] uridylyltransferase [Opitutaceae bacterium]|nr:[protein-PII] uridylyltransferase [Opitutaceae bacterium]